MTRNQREGLEITTVVVSRPGTMQQALRASLATSSWITVVASCGDGLTALQHIALLHPQVVVIDSNLLDEEVVALISTAKLDSPATLYLVLVQTSNREKMALAAGADAVIRRENWVHDFHAVLQQMTQDTIQPDA